MRAGGVLGEVRGERVATAITSRSVVPHTESEWHSLPSKAPEFPPVQLALYPSLPPLDPSCTLSTPWKKDKRDCRDGRTGRQGRGIRTIKAQSHQNLNNNYEKKDSCFNIITERNTVSGDVGDFGKNCGNRQDETFYKIKCRAGRLIHLNNSFLKISFLEEPVFHFFLLK